MPDDLAAEKKAMKSRYAAYNTSKMDHAYANQKPSAMSYAEDDGHDFGDVADDFGGDFGGEGGD